MACSLSSLNYRTLRSQFGVVLQDPSLFSGSIRRNIASHDPDLSLGTDRRGGPIGGDP